MRLIRGIQTPVIQLTTLIRRNVTHFKIVFCGSAICVPQEEAPVSSFVFGESRVNRGWDVHA